MSGLVFAVVLLAAAMHAGWNAIVKGSGDKTIGMVLVAGAGVVIAIAALPILPRPEPASWPFLGASGVVHVAYFALIAGSYRLADMSQAYPLMRGAAPLIVAAVGALLLGEHLSLVALSGIALICGGIIAMAARMPRGAGATLALANAVVIATYTLLDGEGVRRSDAPASYVLWVFLLSGVPFCAWIASRRGGAVLDGVRRGWALGLIGGAATLGAYILVLWAMTRAPIAIVAALRESAILFGLVISAVVLGERLGVARITQAGAILGGIVLLRLG